MIRLPRLPYAYDALAPVMSEDTLRTHHGKHHARYVEVVNRLVRGGPLEKAPLEAILRDARGQGAGALLENAGQAWNHGFFFRGLTAAAGAPGERLRGAMVRGFGRVEAAREAMIEAGARHFGSGWVWLAADAEGLKVTTTHDGESLAESHARPVLVCDVWEHAYYLDHRNDRRAYLAGWWDRLVDWDFAEDQLAAAQAGHAGWEYRDEPPADAGDGDVLEDALDAAEWHLEHGVERAADLDRRRKLAAELEGHARELAEPPAFASGADDLDQRIRQASARLRRDPGGDHWAILPAF